MQSKIENKTQKVLAHLKRGGSINQIQAIDYYKAYRLGSIIFRLNKQGHNIVPTYHGTKGLDYYASYTMNNG